MYDVFVKPGTRGGYQVSQAAAVNRGGLGNRARLIEGNRTVPHRVPYLTTPCVSLHLLLGQGRQVGREEPGPVPCVRVVPEWRLVQYPPASHARGLQEAHEAAAGGVTVSKAVGERREWLVRLGLGNRSV